MAKSNFRFSLKLKFLGHPLFGLMLVGFLVFNLPGSVAARLQQPAVFEVTMAAPDIIRVEVREAEIRKGKIVALPSPEKASYGKWISFGGNERGIVVGPRSGYVRTSDKADFLALDRSTIDKANRYGDIGGRQVLAVFRKSVPWDSGSIGARFSEAKSVASFRHYIYLKLDSPLEAGSFTITWPSKILPSTNFNFNDKKTRASSIRANQVGHRPKDVSKTAYLSLWLPGGEEDGAVDFRRYKLDQFHIISNRGDIVFTGPISLRVGPKDVEPGDGLKGPLNTYTRKDGTTFEANRAGTYVFDLNYSKWRDMAVGAYRIFIPGLGTSDPFKIDNSVWYRAASASMAGLYNQRSGMALDGRFGYTRPECFTEASGIKVRQSKLPFMLSSEGGGFVDFKKAAQAPWITDNIKPDAWGGYQDAGDWDRRIPHVSASYLLLDVYEQLPPGARSVAFGTPASSEVLQHPLYRDKDFPDIIDEAIWNLDFWRRMQGPDGLVSGGIESASTPKPWETCWLESQTVFAYAPDFLSSFAYAAAAAKLAIVLEGLDEAQLAKLYRESAIRAWKAAEKSYSKPKKSVLEAFKILNLPEEKFDKLFAPVLVRAKDSRLWAAGTLFRLTGDKEYNQAVVKRFEEGWVDFAFSRADGVWEYSNARHPGANFKLQYDIRRRLVSVARTYIVNPQFSKVSYRSMKHSGAPMLWGEGMAPNHNEAALLIRAHSITGAKEFLATMLNGSAHILGANQIGMSFTTGLGYRWPLAPLHKDSIMAGVEAPKGITIYGWSLPAVTNYWWVWGPDWAALSDKIPSRRVEPVRTSMPIYEYLIEYPGIIMSAEYTVQQTIATTAAVWIYLNGYDGNSAGN